MNLDDLRLDITPAFRSQVNIQNKYNTNEVYNSFFGVFSSLMNGSGHRKYVIMITDKVDNIQILYQFYCILLQAVLSL